MIAATPGNWQRYTDAFEAKLTALGWNLGPNGTLTIDYQPPGGALGDPSKYAATANQFVTTDPVNVIVTAGAEAALACKSATRGQATPTPVVFAAVGDPVACGLVPKLKNPGGNLTGCSNMQTDSTVIQKRINVMLNKLAPKTVGVIGNPSVGPVSTAMNLAWNLLTNAGISTAPKNLGYFGASDFQSVQTIEAKLAPLQQAGVDVLLVCSDPLFAANADNLIRAAKNLHMRTMYEFREYVRRGGNRSYGPSFTGLFDQAAAIVDQILRGTSPGSIDVYEPSTYVEYPPT